MGGGDLGKSPTGLKGVGTRGSTWVLEGLIKSDSAVLFLGW